jgi:hypothetical protein
VYVHGDCLGFATPLRFGDNLKTPNSGHGIVTDRYYRYRMRLQRLTVMRFGYFATLTGLVALHPAWASAAVDKVLSAVTPARTLSCTLGHATNLDPTKDQSMADVQYEGKYQFTLYLPPVKMRSSPPPGADVPLEAVNPATRVVADPSGLRRGVPLGFAKVVDLWPDRVELTQTIKGPLVHFIVINQIDPALGTANLFMTTAEDIATINLKTVYQGPCRVIPSSKLKPRHRKK